MALKPHPRSILTGLVASLFIGLSLLGPFKPRSAHAESLKSVKALPLRIVTLRVAADEEYRGRAGWEELIRAHIGVASEAFEKDFRIRFQVKDIVYWNSNDHARSLHALLEEVEAEVEPGGADVVLGVSGQRPPWGETLRGGARPLGSKAVVLLSKDLSEAMHPVAVAHEMGHLFGAWHVSEAGTVMNKNAASLRFDKRSAAVIRLTRDLDFKGGFSGFDEETDKKIIELFDASPPPGESNPLVAAYNNFGVRLIEKGRFPEAIVALKKASRLEPEHEAVRRSLLAAYNNQGLALSSAGNYEEAVASYRKALEVDPASDVVQKNLSLAFTGVGVTKERRGRFQEAIAAYREALRRGPDNDTARYNLTNAYRRLLADLANQGRFCESLSVADEAEASGVEVDAATVSALKERCRHSSAR